MMLIEVKLLERNVAVSVLVVPVVEPGFVPAPVLQSFPAENQLPSAAVVFHVALAAWACVPVRTVARTKPRGRSFFMGFGDSGGCKTGDAVYLS